MPVERLDPSRIGVVGGRQADIERFVEHDFRIRSGLCPNGCGLMAESEHGQDCRACGFSCNTHAEKGQPT